MQSFERWWVNAYCSKWLPDNSSWYALMHRQSQPRQLLSFLTACGWHDPIYCSYTSEALMSCSHACSDNKLIGLPADLSFPRLEILDISANSISSLENVMISLTSLKRLSCGKNQLTKMSLRCLTGLLELDAKNCRLDKAPDSLEACRNLKRLDLSLNRIGGFPVFQVVFRAMSAFMASGAWDRC